MVRSTSWTLALIAVGALACFASVAGRSYADDSEGIVRICDQVPGQGGSCQQGGACRGGACGNCRGQGCPNCPSGSCGHGCMHHCGHIGQFINWFHPQGQCPHSPDYGFAPPGKMRTPHPQQVAYRKGFLDAWTGQQGAGMGLGGPRAVSVYMPTDTTQLGYYYQATPRWQARAGMVPPTPNPSLWHRDLCQGQGCQSCRGQVAGGCPHCQNQSYGPGSEVIETQPLPAETIPTPAIEPQPAPVEQNVAPAPPLEKAENPNLQPIN